MGEMRIKTFIGANIQNLEKEINKWFEKEITVIQMLQSEFYENFVITFLYREVNK